MSHATGPYHTTFTEPVLLSWGLLCDGKWTQVLEKGIESSGVILVTTLVPHKGKTSRTEISVIV